LPPLLPEEEFISPAFASSTDAVVLSK